MASLNELFPGQSGRLQLIRVMLLLRRPDLKRLDREQKLPPDLEDEILQALKKVKRA